jgi:hypothetical protein
MLLLVRETTTRGVDPSRILVVRTEALATHPQEVTDAVMRHFGYAGRKIVQALHENNGHGVETTECVEDDILAVT